MEGGEEICKGKELSGHSAKLIIGHIRTSMHKAERTSNYKL